MRSDLKMYLRTLSKIISPFFVILLLFSCDPDPVSNELDQEDLCLVTGMQFRDAAGQLIGLVGNPNISVNDVIVFPIPGDGTIFIQANNELSNVWLIPAEKTLEFQDVDFSSQNVLYSSSVLDEKSNMIWDVGGNNAVFDLSSFPIGYYRLICLSANGEINYDNLYLDPSKSANEIIDFLNGEW